jgi:hypothetical protein
MVPSSVRRIQAPEIENEVQNGASLLLHIINRIFTDEHMSM